MSKKEETKTYRQGDVLLKSDIAVPEGAKKVTPTSGRFILALGEATGHSHTVTAETCEMYQLANGMVLVVKEPTPVIHQEHEVFNVAPGAYWVVHQREYSPEEIRRVMD